MATAPRVRMWICAAPQFDAGANLESCYFSELRGLASSFRHREVEDRPQRNRVFYLGHTLGISRFSLSIPTSALQHKRQK